LFHDPAEIARLRQTKQSLSVYGDGKKIFNKGSREHSIVQEIEEMEKARKTMDKLMEEKNYSCSHPPKQRRIFLSCPTF
jgi:hypothetical protein